MENAVDLEQIQIKMKNKKVEYLSFDNNFNLHKTTKPKKK